MKPEDRIIVALDVSTHEEALRLVSSLGDKINFYKIGLELVFAGLLTRLLDEFRDKYFFVDVKLPDDLPTTVRRTADLAAKYGVRFITLSHSASEETFRAAIDGRAGREWPKFLSVPILSSLGPKEFAEIYGPTDTLQDFLIRRSKTLKAWGADGLIVSGKEISLCRAEFPNMMLVSPGIRPAWAAQDDHKRSCTPSEAIRLGANYIVVGRPIRTASDPREAAQRIIDEIAASDESAAPSSDGERASMPARGGMIATGPVTQ